KHSFNIKRKYEKYASFVDKRQLRNIKENAQNSRVLQFWADVTYRKEDDKSSKNSKFMFKNLITRFLLELKSCDDLVQLDDFKKLVNNIIKEHHKVIIQKTQETLKKEIIQKWKE
ncbi:10214_t:CDS:2, partial [Cetraspora pellucida]